VDGHAVHLDLVRRGAPADEIAAAFRRFRVLCPRRRGPWGVETINRLVDEELRRRGLADTAAAWYAGRPVLVTQNDHTLGLFNGDVGIALPDPDDPGRLRVVFEGEGGRMRAFAPARVPLHETVWATTVHKSQGSEFDRVLLALPDEDAPLMTRELLYTAITRARERVEVWGDETILLAAVERRLVRSSGLRDALWGG
jgi:exodeoxyribonuclease V alpha subunit